MHIYSVLGAERYELCHPVSSTDFETIDVLVNGESRTVGWKPLAMQIVRKDQGRQLSESDSPWLGSHALIFRPRAQEVLSELLLRYGELLPLLCHDAAVAMFNATSVIDALHEDASDVM